MYVSALLLLLLLLLRERKREREREHNSVSSRTRVFEKEPGRAGVLRCPWTCAEFNHHRDAYPKMSRRRRREFSRLSLPLGPQGSRRLTTRSMKSRKARSKPPTPRPSSVRTPRQIYILRGLIITRALSLSLSLSHEPRAREKEKKRLHTCTPFVLSRNMAEDTQHGVPCNFGAPAERPREHVTRALAQGHARHRPAVSAREARLTTTTATTTTRVRGTRGEVP